MAVAAEIMTKEVVTVSPETPVARVADLLAEKNVGALPVVTADGTVQGVVSEEDMVERASRVHLPHHVYFLGSVVYLEDPRKFEAEAEKILALTAGEIMHREFVSVDAQTPVEEVATRLLRDDLRRVLVLDAKGCLRGIITRADIVRMFTAEGRLPD
jgi:CBS domain-containing protein